MQKGLLRDTDYEILAVDGVFPAHGGNGELMEKLGLSAKAIEERIVSDSKGEGRQ